MKQVRPGALVACAGALVASLLAAVLFHRGYRGELPESLALEVGDFMISSGDYAAQSRGGFQPRADVAPLKLKPPIDWDMDPFGDRNWRFRAMPSISIFRRRWRAHAWCLRRPRRVGSRASCVAIWTGSSTPGVDWPSTSAYHCGV